MKYGYRKPNVKARVKARTTGKVNRSIKRAVNPTYGKKGMGMIKDPKKAMYNRVYSRTTTDLLSSGSSNHSGSSGDYSSWAMSEVSSAPKTKQKTGRVMIGFGVFCIVGFFAILQPGYLILAALLLFFGIRRYRKFKSVEKENGESE